MIPKPTLGKRGREVGGGVRTRGKGRTCRNIVFIKILREFNIFVTQGRMHSQIIPASIPNIKLKTNHENGDDDDNNNTNYNDNTNDGDNESQNENDSDDDTEHDEMMRCSIGPTRSNLTKACPKTKTKMYRCT